MIGNRSFDLMATYMRQWAWAFFLVASCPTNSPAQEASLGEISAALEQRDARVRQLRAEYSITVETFKERSRRGNFNRGRAEVPRLELGLTTCRHVFVSVGDRFRWSYDGFAQLGDQALPVVGWLAFDGEVYSSYEPAMIVTPDSSLNVDYRGTIRDMEDPMLSMFDIRDWGLGMLNSGAPLSDALSAPTTTELGEEVVGGRTIVKFQFAAGDGKAVEMSLDPDMGYAPITISYRNRGFACLIELSEFVEVDGASFPVSGTWDIYGRGELLQRRTLNVDEYSTAAVNTHDVVGVFPENFEGWDVPKGKAFRIDDGRIVYLNAFGLPDPGCCGAGGD